jgi:hypothetical protein
LSTAENLLRKYVFDGAAWSQSGSISAGGAINVAGITNGTVNSFGDAIVTLYLTSGTTIFTCTDSSGYGGLLTGSLTSLAKT